MECRLKNMSVNYEVRGEGRPILLIHGYSPDHRMMEGCMEPIFLEVDGWKRIYIDLPGMGRTRAPEWLRNADQMLDIVLEFASSVIGGRSFALAGESYGGYLSRGIVCRRPELVDGMLLICPCIIPDASKRSLPPKTLLVRNEESMAGLSEKDLEAFNEMAVVQSQRHWERFRDEIMPGLELADEEFLNRFQRDGYAFSFDTDRLQEPFAKPSLILTGRQDAAVGYRDAFSIIENYPRASFAALDMAGHNVQIEQETLFSALVKEWLQRLLHAPGE